jgi:hypothetical protein
MLSEGLPPKAPPPEALLTLFGKFIIKILQPQVPCHARLLEVLNDFPNVHMYVTQKSTP